jgi:hypothetical protein
MQKKLFYSYAESGLPAVVNNGSWATNVTATSATLSAKLVYATAAPTEVTLYWGTADGGTDAAAWQQSKALGGQSVGTVATAEITGLQPWTTYYYRAAASNAKGVVWAGATIPFHTAGILPDGWQAGFIGHPQRPGSGATFADGVFTVRGSGRDIAEGPERIDNFQFVYQKLTGDGEITARIATAEVKSREPKIGIMLREGVTAGARNVALLLVPRAGVRLSARVAESGGSSSKLAPLAKAAPCWVKLTRRGNTFTGAVSMDGQAWQAVGAPVTIEMNAELCAGLAVTAGCRDESKLHTSAFDHVSVSKP